MDPKKYHLARSFALGFRDGFVIIGAMYMVVTTVDLFNGTRSIHPTPDDYIMFLFFWAVVFVARAAFGKHPELPRPPRKTVRQCLSTHFFHTGDAPQPAGAYSQGVSRGNVLALAGQVGIAPDTGDMAEGITAQTQQALANLFAVVRAAGTAPGAIIHVRVYLADKNDFAAMNTAYQEFFEANGAAFQALPARTTIGVDLPEGMLVEIDALAVHSS